MIRTFAISLLTLLSPVFISCEKTPEVIIPDTPMGEQEENGESNGDDNNTAMPDQIKITVSGKSLPVKIEDNEATRALVGALREASITYEADDYGGFEKVGPLGRSLPTSNSQITTQAGDVMFYGTNSWSYTRIGKMEYGTLDELKTFLKAGQGKISVTLSL